MLKINGIVKAFLYASYNCVILIPVLIPIKNKLNTKKTACLISWITGVFLLILCFSIYNLLLQGNSDIFSLEMPIIGVVKQFGKTFKIVYILIIAISILTSAVSAGCGFLNNCSKNEQAYNRNLFLISTSAIVLSQISFSTFVELLYPVLGMFGSFEILLILLNKI